MTAFRSGEEWEAGNSSRDELTEAQHFFLLHLSEGEGALDLDDLVRKRPDLEVELRSFHAEFFQLQRELRELGTRSADSPTPTRGDAADAVETAELLAPFQASRHGARDYFRVARIARGGFAVVEKVWDARLRRVVARKALPLDVRNERLAAADARRLSRFLAEAQIQSQLSHPAILPVVDLGIDEEGRPYFTMPLVHGEHFGKVIERVQRGESGNSVERALHVLVDACDAMAYAHEKGVIHRDLKPQNLMVGRFGETFLMDWGLARVERKSMTERGSGALGSLELSTLRCDLAPDAAEGMATLEGDVLGTPAFMAPEQAAGRVSEIGHLADQYSLGAILYQLLTGRAPYSDPTTSTSPKMLVDAVRHDRPTAVNEIAAKTPLELVAICERAMARVPAERYPSVRALGEDLRAYLEGRVVRAHATGALAELQKWTRRNKSVATVTALALLTTIAALGGGYWIQAKSNRALKEEQVRSEARLQKALWASYRSDLKEVQGRIDANDITPEVHELLGACTPEHRGWEWDWLDHRLDESERVLLGHESSVSAVAFLPDGERCISTSYDGSARVWDLATGDCLRVIRAHRDLIDCMALSADGHRLVTGSRDHRLRSWDLESGEQLGECSLPHVVWSLCMLEDGRVLSGCEDGFARVHDGASLEVEASLPRFDSHVTAVDGSGDLLAAGDLSGIVRVCRLPALELAKQLEVGAAVRFLEFDQDRALFLAPDNRGLLVCRAAESEAKEVPIEWPAGPRDRTGQYASCRFDWQSGWAWASTFSAVECARSSDGSSARLFGHGYDTCCVAFARDGRMGLTGHADGSIRTWKLDRLDSIREIQASDGEVVDLCFDPGSSKLYVSGVGGVLTVHDLEDAASEARRIDTGQERVRIVPSSDGRLVLTVKIGGSHSSAMFWDSETWTPVDVNDGMGPTADAEWSSDRAFVVFGHMQGATIWYGWPEERTFRSVTRSHTLRVEAVAIAPTNDRFATIDQSGDVCVWRASDGEKLLEWRAHETRGMNVQWSSDGRHIATGGCEIAWGSPKVKLFDAATGEVLASIDTWDLLFSLAFSPDGRRLAFSDGKEGFLRLIDTDSYEPVLSLSAGKAPIRRIAFSPDGRYLAAGDANGTVHVWWAGPKDREPRAK